jgi:thiol-disulfide isomerase/thioredoxin
LLVPFLFACNQTEKSGATLTGSTTNLTAGHFILGGPGGARDSIFLNADGTFTHTFADLTKPANYYILVGTNDYMPFRVAPGMDLAVTFDAANFRPSLKFDGKGSDINNYLVNKTIKAGNQDYEMYKLDPDAFRAKQDSTRSLMQEILSAAQKSDAKDPFWKTQEGNILYEWAINLSNYEAYHGYFAGVEGYKAPESFFSFVKEVDLNKPEYLESDAFKQYVSSTVGQAVQKKTEALKKADSTAQLNMSKIKRETALELLTSKQVLDQYLYDDLSGEIQWKDLEGEVQESIDYFVANCKDTALVNSLKTQVDEWRRLGKGQPAFDFTGKDLQGNSVSLSDFRGKLVYVDVWATWCGPCKYEIPYLDTLETDYHGKNIVFISYSIDEDKAAWEKFVPEKQLKGVQIIGENAWQSDLCKKYKIMGVPTFMLFDTEGKIVSVKMTRPSDKKTRETFDGLL